MTSALDRNLRVLITHDWLVAWAGAERVLQELLVVFPQADVVTGFIAPSIHDLNPTTRRARETWLARLPIPSGDHRWLLPFEALAFATLDTRGYDLVLSSSHAFSKCVRRGPDSTHVSYCYSPPRYLWDLLDEHSQYATPVQRMALRLGAAPLRAVDRWSSRGVDQFVAISEYVADRIRRCYGRESAVVYPPVVLLDSAPASERGDFLLTLGRLVPYKRVDLAIRAAERLRVPLVVAGDGPERRRLEALAGPYTTFLGRISDEEAIRLFSRCRAFLFCAREDFGIAPVEANGYGAPVVAFGAGGVLETLVPGVTAEFFDRQEVDAIVMALDRALGRTWNVARMRENAERFAPARFRQAIKSVVRKTLTSEGRVAPVAP